MLKYRTFDSSQNMINKESEYSIQIYIMQKIRDAYWSDIVDQVNFPTNESIFRQNAYRGCGRPPCTPSIYATALH